MYRDMIDFHDVERQVSSKASMQTHLENQQPEGHERHFYIYKITVCMYVYIYIYIYIYLYNIYT